MPNALCDAGGREEKAQALRKELTDYNRAEQTFPVKDQAVNILGFAG